MPREEKSSSMGSINNVPSGSSGAEGGSSLAARRARLRGSLARASMPADEAPLQTETPVPESDSTPAVQSPGNVEAYLNNFTQSVQSSPKFQSDAEMTTTSSNSSQPQQHAAGNEVRSATNDSTGSSGGSAKSMSAL